ADSAHQLDEELAQAQLRQGVVGDELELAQRRRRGLGLLAGRVLGGQQTTQLLLDAFALRDVHHRADHAHGAAVLIVKRGGPRGAVRSRGCMRYSIWYSAASVIRSARRMATSIRRRSRGSTRARNAARVIGPSTGPRIESMRADQVARSPATSYSQSPRRPV